MKELRQSIRGEVRFDIGSRALYATDSSNYRQARRSASSLRLGPEH